ncbi:MAG: carboxy terminal-processing peptidase, partial [Limisphaerales bacterium]
SELKKRSEQRIERNTDFGYILEDIERFKRNLARKSVSLNEQKRLAEMREIKAIADARKKERAARKIPNEKIYEITLKNVDQPGLPAPMARTNEVALAESSAVASEIHGDVTAEVGAAENGEEEKTPAFDATLVETKHILLDYISLIGKGADGAITLVK